MAEVQLEVNGRAYVVGCEDGQEAHLRELAASLDAQVRRLAGEVGPLGETRLMLMSALILADELGELRAQLDQTRAELAEAKASLGRAELKAIAALEAAAEKIESLAAD